MDLFIKRDGCVSLPESLIEYMDIHLMRKKNSILFVLFYTVFLSFLAPGTLQSEEVKISGTLDNGFRLLVIQESNDPQTFTVYRGDYIKFVLPKGMESPVAKFPTLNQSKALSHDLSATAYFKMKQKGVHPFQINALQGQIRVVGYHQKNYQELTAKEADAFIKSENPFVLDVRTPREYQIGHLKDSSLLPVQVLQRNINKLASYKDKPILIYCATGNRSTVASKILIDAGFKRILNLRYGIVDWAKRQYPVDR